MTTGMLHCSWWDYSWNPFVGCSAIPGDKSCGNCYAQYIVDRYKWPDKNGNLTRGRHEGVTHVINGKALWNGKVIIHPYDHPVWQEPYLYRPEGWRALNLGPKGPPLCFVGDISDCFHPDVPDEAIDLVIETMICVGHIAMFSTKRPERMLDYFLQRSPDKLWITQRHIWPGISAPNQHWFDTRWPYLYELADKWGWQTFVSLAPLMERVVLPKELLDLGDRIWLLTGGEQTTEKQDVHELDPAWATALKRQCKPANVPFYTLQGSRRETLPLEVFSRGVPKLLSR
jgi:protein gp37